jgi:hypothetical protein
MTMRMILLLTAALVGGSALAEDAAKLSPFDASKYLVEVQKALGYASDECKAHDSGEATFGADAVTTLDLTGDGRSDYIVQFGDTQCAAGTRAVFCGSGGCLMNILVTLPNGKVRKVFDGYVRSYDIRPDPSQPTQGPPHHRLRPARCLLRRTRHAILPPGQAHHHDAIRIQDAEVIPARGHCRRLRDGNNRFRFRCGRRAARWQWPGFLLTSKSGCSCRL